MKQIFITAICLTIFTGFVISLNQDDTKVIYIKSDNKNQVITIFERGNIRMICDGLLKEVPEENYVIIDFEKIDSTSDAFYYCWVDNGWNAFIPKVEVIESNFSSEKYSFSSELPRDERGIPTSISFSKDNCNIYDFNLGRLMKEEGSVSIHR